jgi:hypothetical protein
MSAKRPDPIVYALEICENIISTWSDQSPIASYFRKREESARFFFSSHVLGMMYYTSTEPRLAKYKVEGYHDSVIHGLATTITDSDADVRIGDYIIQNYELEILAEYLPRAFEMDVNSSNVSDARIALGVLTYATFIVRLAEAEKLLESIGATREEIRETWNPNNPIFMISGYQLQSHIFDDVITSQQRVHAFSQYSQTLFESVNRNIEKYA